MTKNEAKLEMFKIDRRVEKLIEHAQRMTRTSTTRTVVDARMQLLWRKRYY